MRFLKLLIDESRMWLITEVILFEMEKYLLFLIWSWIFNSRQILNVGKTGLTLLLHDQGLRYSQILKAFKLVGLLKVLFLAFIIESGFNKIENPSFIKLTKGQKYLNIFDCFPNVLFRYEKLYKHKNGENLMAWTQLDVKQGKFAYSIKLYE